MNFIRYIKFLLSVRKQLPRVLKNKKQFYSTIHLHKKESDTIFILGNGPSLKHQLDNPDSSLLLTSNTCICVNCFVLTEYYNKIKPKIYLLVDPALFLPVSIKEIEDEVLAVWNNLFEKTTWNIEVIVSSQFRNNDRVCRLKENKNINILFFNQTDCSVYRGETERFKLFNENKLSVPAQTVLNTAVYLGIFWRYKNIVLIGADTSWHEEFRVDQKTNELFTERRHFYNTKKVRAYRDDQRTIPAKIHEEFYCVTRVFELYWFLREYAKFNSVKVFNASTKSYIDAFERISLDAFYQTSTEK
jgi:hypothetical protein